MVFKTLTNFSRNFTPETKGPDRFWKRRKIRRLAAHFYGRKRNCYRLALGYLQKSWQYVRVGRQLRKQRMTKLWEQRISAACSEHGLNLEAFRAALLHLDILLNRKVLADLATFEPRTFKSLANLAMGVNKEAGLNAFNSWCDPPPPGVFTRNMLKAKP